MWAMPQGHVHMKEMPIRTPPWPSHTIPGTLPCVGLGGGQGCTGVPEMGGGSDPPQAGMGGISGPRGAYLGSAHHLGMAHLSGCLLSQRIALWAPAARGVRPGDHHRGLEGSHAAQLRSGGDGQGAQWPGPPSALPTPLLAAGHRPPFLSPGNRWPPPPVPLPPCPPPPGVTMAIQFSVK